jgi:hypothetical protein
MKNIDCLLALVLAVVIIPSQAKAQFQGGRVVEDRETFHIGLTAGTIFGLDGEVRETTRPFYELQGRGAPPENYSWDELGFDDSFVAYGFFMEKMWRYITLQTRLFHGVPELSGTADRDYYIGVGGVNFNGREYDYLKIPRGTSYSGELDIYALNLNMRITPFSIGNDDYFVEFVPWIHVGLFGFLGDYVIDAGRASGVVQYENPPRDYVVGGRATGTSGLVVPELGLGGEFRFFLTDGATLHLGGNIAFLNFDGNTSDFGISSRNEKDLELDYVTVSGRLLLEIALNDRMNLLLGVELQSWTAEAESRASAKTEEEIRELREKFDKDISLEMSSIMGLVGLSF